MRSEETSPCIGDTSLEGVYFHPNVKEEPTGAEGDANSSGSKESRSGKALDIDGDYAARQVKALCPGADTSNLAVYEDVHEDTLLIITFYRKEYHNIPLLEILYRPHFKNILYCGTKKLKRKKSTYNQFPSSYFTNYTIRFLLILYRRGRSDCR